MKDPVWKESQPDWIPQVESNIHSHSGADQAKITNTQIINRLVELSNLSATAPLSYDSASGVFSLANSGATAGTYGTSTKTLQVTISAKGIITAIQNVSIVRNLGEKVIADTTALTVGDGLGTISVPVEFNGMNLVSVGMHVYTASSSGLPTVQIRNATDGVDMLSTKVSVDVGEFDSVTATTPPVINTATDDVATGDVLAFDVDIAGTGTAGLEIRMGFSSP